MVCLVLSTVEISFLGPWAVMQITHALLHLLQNFYRLQWGECVDRLPLVNNIVPNDGICRAAGKQDSVMTVHIYSLVAKTFDCKRVFRFLSRTVGSSVEWYADALLPTLS